MTEQACTCEALRLAERRVAELEGGFRLILLGDYRGPKPEAVRIAEEVLAAKPGEVPVVVWCNPGEVGP